MYGGGWADCALPEDVCDGQDNNCDGVVDGDFVDPVSGLYQTNEHCGKCGTNCSTSTSRMEQASAVSWKAFLCVVFSVAPLF